MNPPHRASWLSSRDHLAVADCPPWWMCARRPRHNVAKVTENKFSAGQAAAAAPDGDGPAGAGDERAAIAVVDSDDGQRETLAREMSTRYGADYRIVVWDKPAEVGTRIRKLLATGTPVALVIGGVSSAHLVGVEVLGAGPGHTPHPPPAGGPASG